MFDGWVVKLWVWQALHLMSLKTFIPFCAEALRGLQTALPLASTPLAKSHWLGAPLNRMKAVAFSIKDETKLSTSAGVWPT